MRFLPTLSRTHSQLSQVVSELHRTPFASSMSVVVLASRGVLCVNEAVRALGSNAAINDRCQDLTGMKSSGSTAQSKRARSDQLVDIPGGDDVVVDNSNNKENSNNHRTRGKSKSSACPFYNQSKTSALQDALLGAPMDVEELGTLGRRMGGCPYFAARRAVAEADVVLLPYNAVLIKACGLVQKALPVYIVTVQSSAALTHTGNTAGTGHHHRQQCTCV